jgi:hypothetical protein
MPVSEQYREPIEIMQAPFIGESSYRTEYVNMENNPFPAYKEITTKQLPIKFTGLSRYNEQFTNPDNPSKTKRLPKL